MVASHSGNRHGGRAGKGCMDTGSSGIYFRNGILLLLDSVIPHLHLDTDKPEGMKTKVKRQR